MVVEVHPASAGHVMTPSAGPALTAGANQRHHHLLPDDQSVGLTAHLRYPAGGLVAQHHRVIDRPAAIHVGQVGVADAARLNGHPHLVGAGIGQG